MLRHLSIENYALIDSLEIDFDAGLNTITGETGAGKSILLGAVSLLCGARADAGVMRDPGRPCVVEGTFAVGGYGLEPLFEQEEIDYADECVIRRVISPSGKSRAFINDLPVNLGALKQIGERLLDIHSQHQTLLLAEGDFQMNVLDSIAGHGTPMAQYKAAYASLTESRRALAVMRTNAEAALREQDYLSHLHNELSAAKLAEGEQQELERRQEELTHATQIRETLLSACDTMNEDERGVLPELKSMAGALSKLSGVYSHADGFAARMQGCYLELKDLTAEMEQEGERVDTDQEQLDKTVARLDLIFTLCQKYRCADIASLLELEREAGEKLETIEHFDRDIERLQKAIGESEALCRAAAAQIRKKREEAAVRAMQYVVDQLVRLGMPHAVLKIELSDAGGLTPNGADAVRFMFSANSGAALQPIEKVASGGEMSRLMLSIKSLVASHLKLPTVIFDEIDTGVSGGIADKMGEIISALGRDMQVINITHLPQIASKGAHHYHVYKQSEAGATATGIRKLSPSERVAEIAAMLSGSSVTEAALRQAETLLGEAGK